MRKKKNIEIYLAIAFLILLISSPQRSLAFDPTIHEVITRNGLFGASYSHQDGIFVRFTDEVMSQISTANKDVDSCFLSKSEATCAGVVPGSAKQHFDDNLLAEGTAFVDKSLVEIMKVIKSIPADADFDNDLASTLRVFTARSKFGEVLHSIQDFYSHSTWVEKNGTNDGIPWADSVYRSEPVSGPTSAYNEIRRSGGSGSSCKNGHEFEGTSSAGITTEYFLSQSQIASLGGCVHGPGSALLCRDVGDLTVKDAGLCLLGFYSAALDDDINGINKDTKKRRYHNEARHLAERATTLVANSLLGAIGGYSKSVLCVFVGLRAPCNGDIVVYTVASGGPYEPWPGAVGYFASTGVLSTPISIEVTTTKSIEDTRQKDTRQSYPVTVTKSSGVQGTYLFNSGSNLSNYVPKKICMMEGKWIPRTYRWAVHNYTPQNGTGYSSSSAQTRDWSGEMRLNPDGVLTVTYKDEMVDDYFYTEPGSGSYTQVTDSRYLMNKTYTINLFSGAGSWSETADSTGKFRQSYPGYPDYTYATTTRTTQIGAGEWPAESRDPPSLQGVFLRKVRSVSAASGVPAECTEP